MSVFSTLNVYGGKYEVVSTSKLDQDELATCAKVVVENHPLQDSPEVPRPTMCFYRAGGTTVFVPVSRDSTTLNIGDLVDPSSIELIQLAKEGSSTIVRADGMPLKQL